MAPNWEPLRTPFSTAWPPAVVRRGAAWSTWAPWPETKEESGFASRDMGSTTMVYLRVRAVLEAFPVYLSLSGHLLCHEKIGA